ncbi:hypothetical protein [Hydrogenivirga sp. 128-5-R1-1]|uniref:hypothetical protein n=1 Tax=Hydrogenivirga sp. 128-5-R1-1 TaxID=392423 RepID=UPI00015F0C08|nr:hypothetical protein [Hydrogenivirga sp. 128-5-R1-1]EDP73621.1 hypothetical protein HG1285_09206 [Hydrogenivirga sp. 128-5-R1-1]
MKNINLVFQEIDKHKERLEYAINKIQQWNNFDTDVFENPEKVAIIDSFIFRFAKMQDTMGEKLFPLILNILGEETRNKPFIDILNRLEQLEYIPSANEWKELRKIRNLLTHTYPWEQEILLQEIKNSLKYAKELIEIYENIKEKIKPYINKG